MSAAGLFYVRAPVLTIGGCVHKVCIPVNHRPLHVRGALP